MNDAEQRPPLVDYAGPRTYRSRERVPRQTAERIRQDLFRFVLIFVAGVAVVAVWMYARGQL